MLAGFDRQTLMNLHQAAEFQTDIFHFREM